MSVCIESLETGERKLIPDPVWITRNRNGVLRTPFRAKALGVFDGEQNWSFGALEGYPEAKIITRAEYEESLCAPEEDPELTDAQALQYIMEGNYEA